MTLNKAINRLRGFLRWRKPDPDDNFHEAVQLGLNALIFYRKLKATNKGEIQGNFLGETPE